MSALPINGHARPRFVPAPRLTPLQEDVMHVIADYPQTAKRLANRAGRKRDSNFGQALTDLSRLGFVVRVADGWKRVPVLPHRTQAQCMLRVARLYRMLARAIEQAHAEEGGGS